jgi:hypothetical protein
MFHRFGGGMVRGDRAGPGGCSGGSWWGCWGWAAGVGLLGWRGWRGLAGALFTTSQQTGAAIGLAILATAAAARTAHAGGSLVAGYQLSFLIGTGIAVLAGVLVMVQLRSPRTAP